MTLSDIFLGFPCFPPCRHTQLGWIFGRAHWATLGVAPGCGLRLARLTYHDVGRHVLVKACLERENQDGQLSMSRADDEHYDIIRLVILVNNWLIPSIFMHFSLGKLGHSSFIHHPILVHLWSIDFGTIKTVQRNRCKAKVVWRSFI